MDFEDFVLKLLKIILVIVCSIWIFAIIFDEYNFSKAKLIYGNGVVIGKQYEPPVGKVFSSRDSKYCLVIKINNINKISLYDDKQLYFSLEKGDSLIVSYKSFNGMERIKSIKIKE